MYTSKLEQRIKEASIKRQRNSYLEEMIESEFNKIRPIIEADHLHNSKKILLSLLEHTLGILNSISLSKEADLIFDDLSIKSFINDAHGMLDDQEYSSISFNDIYIMLQAINLAVVCKELLVDDSRIWHYFNLDTFIRLCSTKWNQHINLVGELLAKNYNSRSGYTNKCSVGSMYLDSHFEKVCLSIELEQFLVDKKAAEQKKLDKFADSIGKVDFDKLANSIGK